MHAQAYETRRSKEVGKGHYELQRLPIRSSSICCSIRARLRMPPRGAISSPAPSAARSSGSLEATFALLDAWQAPEPSPYFDQKLAVRLREEQALAPAGWFERLKSRLLFNTGRQFRPALAGALGIASGGWWWNLCRFLWLASLQRRRPRPRCRICRFSIKTIRRCRRWISSCRTTVQPRRRHSSQQLV